MDVNQLEQFIVDQGIPKFRLQQIKKAVFQDCAMTFAEITNLPKQLREQLTDKFEILSFDIEKVLQSKDGRSAKALLKLQDDNVIETVLISPKSDLWSVCISSQVGCALGCEFCATGKLGFIRNLTAEEITDQVLFWKQYLKKQVTKNNNQTKTEFRISNFEFRNYDITNVVFMGMGEPFINWDNVKRSLGNLMEKAQFGFGARSIAVSTAGIPAGIIALAEEFPQVNLAVSLHFSDDEKRSRFMRVNKKFDLEKLKVALQTYFQITNRKVFVEYVMMDGQNDQRSDAEKLAEYLKSIGKPHLLHVNLIRYNETSGSCKPSSRSATMQFKGFLLKHHINATIRKSLGQDIQGACGQLAGRNKLIGGSAK